MRRLNYKPPKCFTLTLLLYFSTFEHAPNFFNESLAFNFHCKKGVAFLQEIQSYIFFDIIHYDMNLSQN